MFLIFQLFFLGTASDRDCTNPGLFTCDLGRVKVSFMFFGNRITPSLWTSLTVLLTEDFDADRFLSPLSCEPYHAFTRAQHYTSVR